MEEVSAAISGPCAVPLGEAIRNDPITMMHAGVNGCKLVAEKASSLSPSENELDRACEFVCEGDRGGNGIVSWDRIESDDSCISREHNHRGIEEDRSLLSFDGNHENSSSQSVVACDISSICVEESSALEVNSERISSISDVQDVKRVAAGFAGDDGNKSDKKSSVLEVPQQKKIRKTEIKHRFELGNMPLWGFTSICGRRPEMEDAVVTIPRFSQVPSRMLKVENIENGTNHGVSDLTAHFFGVYDGHGGCEVANYCRERMHLAIAEEIETAISCIREGTVEHDWQEQWKKAFSNSFIKVDAEIGGVRKGANNTDNEPIAPETVGSTAVVAVVSPTHIIVANCGDSRAVLYRGKHPMPLSVDHKPDREDEHARIEAAGGKVIQWNGSRVSGVLAMSRSIGDRYLKPWIIPDPEVTFFPRAKEDECLVLASDGLWDVISNKEACEVARKRILLWHKKHGDKLSAERGDGVDPAAQSASDYLSKIALSKGSRDNITVIVLDLKAKRKFKKKT
ncbi:Protein phosphatase 2C 16 [Hibiscus syriacus]|uniref:protein-serine/threonine phosphatase n=1 Tax=Hibiscus syriacus TaxID=106335 RepID=A0A6A3B6D6_HIBSY|nr:protein phosphatase 2C 77-like [Hibiscus syriacus]KAE8712540.1 Protein phosphatase 2C 16 [Hibiscus syriacus]